MPRRVLLIRHCQSEANRDGRLEGSGDSPLTELGREQARRLAQFIADQQIGEATLIASPLTRASSTAAEIAAACGWAASHDLRIVEGHMGWMEDLTYAEMVRHMTERGTRELNHHLHGGESVETVAGRLQQAIEEAMAGSQKTLVMVSHGFAIHCLVRSHGHEISLAGIQNGDVVEFWYEDGAPTGPPAHYPLGA